VVEQHHRTHCCSSYVSLMNDENWSEVVYVGQNKRCDRILWKGEGVEQLWYVRGESKFSDHRPVYSLFSVHVDKRCTKLSSCIAPSESSSISMSRSCSSRTLTNAGLSSSCFAKVQAEEQLLLLTREHKHRTCRVLS